MTLSRLQMCTWATWRPWPRGTPTATASRSGSAASWRTHSSWPMTTTSRWGLILDLYVMWFLRQAWPYCHIFFAFLCQIFNSHTTIRNLVLWQGQNGAIFQTGWWKERLAENVLIENVDVIHVDWCTNLGWRRMRYKKKKRRKDRRAICKLAENKAFLANSGFTSHYQMSNVSFRYVGRL